MRAAYGTQITPSGRTGKGKWRGLNPASMMELRVPVLVDDVVYVLSGRAKRKPSAPCDRLHVYCDQYGGWTLDFPDRTPGVQPLGVVTHLYFCASRLAAGAEASPVAGACVMPMLPVIGRIWKGSRCTRDPAPDNVADLSL